MNLPELVESAVKAFTAQFQCIMKGEFQSEKDLVKQSKWAHQDDTHQDHSNIVNSLLVRLKTVTH